MVFTPAGSPHIFERVGDSREWTTQTRMKQAAGQKIFPEHYGRNGVGSGERGVGSLEYRLQAGSC